MCVCVNRKDELGGKLKQDDKKEMSYEIKRNPDK